MKKLYVFMHFIFEVFRPQEVQDEFFYLNLRKEILGNHLNFLILFFF